MFGKIVFGPGKCDSWENQVSLLISPYTKVFVSFPDCGLFHKFIRITLSYFYSLQELFLLQ